RRAPMPSPTTAPDAPAAERLTTAEIVERYPGAHLDAGSLEAGLGTILDSPKDAGAIGLIVRRPGENERELLEVAELDVAVGLVGDNWSRRRSSKTEDGSPHPEMQLNLMNSRVVDLVAGGDRRRWPLAGDQFFVDLDLGRDNLPPGTRLALGTAELEVTAMPHLGCKKFVERFGIEAMKFVNSGPAKKQCLRGINARVVRPGTVTVGDEIRVLR
ncbi:MAG: MOSC domain-containing protein, partial [Acidobacteriota bacterium]